MVNHSGNSGKNALYIIIVINYLLCINSYLLLPIALSGTVYMKSINKFSMIVNSSNKRVRKELNNIK